VLQNFNINIESFYYVAYKILQKWLNFDLGVHIGIFREILFILGSLWLKIN
jgi:hypothetical protein